MGRRSPADPVCSIWTTAEPTSKLPQSPALAEVSAADMFGDRRHAASVIPRIDFDIQWLICFLL
jgi:hypothetical protein